MKFSVQELRPEVLAFALLMEARLREKDADKGTSWKTMREGDLTAHVVSFAMRLEQAVRLRFFGRRRHAVDLANYCMMIADVAGALVLPKEILPGRDDEQTFAVLYLVGGHNVTKEAIASWSNEECVRAEEWAMAIHLQASDNDDVVVPKVPACVIPFLEH